MVGFESGPMGCGYHDTGLKFSVSLQAFCNKVDYFYREGSSSCKDIMGRTFLSFGEGSHKRDKRDKRERKSLGWFFFHCFFVNGWIHWHTHGPRDCSMTFVLSFSYNCSSEGFSCNLLSQWSMTPFHPFPVRLSGIAWPGKETGS